MCVPTNWFREGLDWSGIVAGMLHITDTVVGGTEGSVQGLKVFGEASDGIVPCLGSGAAYRS